MQQPPQTEVEERGECPNGKAVLLILMEYLQGQYQHIGRQLTGNGLVANRWYLRRKGHTAEESSAERQSASPAISSSAKLKSVVGARHTDTTSFIDIHESDEW